MALVVEDGTGKSDAESYVSISEVDSYFSLRGVADWDGLPASPSPTAAQEAILRKATEYIDSTYAELFKGSRVVSDQALAWPRYGAEVDGVTLASDALPVALKRATCEVAKLIAGGEDVTPVLERGNRIKTKTETVGPISQRIAYADDAPVVNIYTAVHRYMKPLLDSSASVRSVVRG